MRNVYDCNFNIICYHPWKEGPSSLAVVPSNSRPIPQSRKWQAPGRPMPDCSNGWCGDNNIPLGVPTINHADYVSGAGFIRRRSIQGASKNAQGVWYRATPNPIKHWRKQLFPRQGDLPGAVWSIPSERISISQTMERPGGTVNLDQNYNYGTTGTKGSCDWYHPPNTLITSFWIKPDERRTSCENPCDLSGNTVTYTTRISPNTTFSKDYHSSAKSYLQSRTKLYKQRLAIQFNRSKNIIKDIPKPNTFESLYLQDTSGCFTPLDCSCVVQVIYKPRNTLFAKNDPVDGSLYTKYIKRSTITQNQYNITNKWGLDGVDTIKDYPLLHNRLQVGRRKPASGSGPLRACCPIYIPSPPVGSLSGFMFLIGDSLWATITGVPLSDLSAVPIIPNSMEVFVTPGYSVTQTLVRVVYVNDGGASVSDGGFNMNVLLDLITPLGISYNINITQWGDIPFSNGAPGFQFGNSSGSNVWTGKNTASDTPTFLPNTNLTSAFLNVTIPNSDFGNMSSWDTSNVINMSSIFQGATNFNQNISLWDVANVTNMNNMFNGASNFNQDLNSWNTSSVTHMYRIFTNCTNFVGTGLETWKTSLITNMDSMFQGCSNIFNPNLSDWNVSNVAVMYNMFYNCIGFTGIGLNNWKTQSVNSLDCMFCNTTAFNQDIGGWDLTSLTSANNMLNDCGMSQSNYDNLLIGWAANLGGTTPNGITLGALNLHYSDDGAVGRIKLIAAGWTINGDITP